MECYIACALTHVPRHAFDDHVRFIHALAAAIESSAAQPTVRYALKNSDPQLSERPQEDRARLCYEWDRNMVLAADIVVAEASFPSVGLGIELELASSNSTPIVLCYREDISHRVEAVRYTNPDHRVHDLQIGEGYVSLMVLGLPHVRRIVAYRDEIEGIRQIVDSLNATIAAGC